MSLLKRLQQDLTCTKVPWFPADNARAARLINDIVIGEETDVDPDGSYVSRLDLYLRAMADVGASTHQFETFRSLARVGTSVERSMVRTGTPPHVRAFVAHTMTLAQSGSTGEVVAAFFYGREDIIPEMFNRLQKTLPGTKDDKDRLRHFVYYIERHIELDGDSHGPMGRELLDNLVADSPQGSERAPARRVQQHPADRALEWHIEPPFEPRAPREGCVRNVSRGTVDGRSSAGSSGSTHGAPVEISMRRPQLRYDAMNEFECTDLRGEDCV
jgi:hypothetical protein